MTGIRANSHSNIQIRYTRAREDKITRSLSLSASLIIAIQGKIIEWKVVIICRLSRVAQLIRFMKNGSKVQVGVVLSCWRGMHGEMT